MVIPPSTTQLDLARAYLRTGAYLRYEQGRLTGAHAPLHPARHAFIERAVRRHEETARC